MRVLGKWIREGETGYQECRLSGDSLTVVRTISGHELMKKLCRLICAVRVFLYVMWFDMLVRLEPETSTMFHRIGIIILIEIERAAFGIGIWRRVTSTNSQQKNLKGH